MPRYVGLLRGLNLGGKHRLSMQELGRIFTEAACTNVVTYIQSGNVVFETTPGRSKKLPELIPSMVQEQFGITTPLVIRSAPEMQEILGTNPFRNDSVEASRLHVYFLSATPTPASVEKLDANRSPGDHFAVVGKEIFLDLSNGMGRSKLTNAYFDSKLSVISTARNWQTVQKLAALASGVHS
jgi:uncharacterized protein (DUF1697 family)